MVGIVLTEIMHTIQHLAYGYGSDGLYVSFREGVAQASPARRIVVVACCGVVVGLGWWLLKRYGRPQPGIKPWLKIRLPVFRFLKLSAMPCCKSLLSGWARRSAAKLRRAKMTAAFASVGVNRFG